MIGTAKQQNPIKHNRRKDIRRAIREDRCVSFTYMTYDVQGGRIPKHRGFSCTVSPYDTVRKGDRYYLIGFSEKHGRTVSFRIDRIGRLCILKKERLERLPEYSLQDFLDKAFSLCDKGREDKITLRCRAGIPDRIRDRFGARAVIRETGEDFFEAEADVILSATFYSWLFQYTGEISLVAPCSAVDAYTRRLEQALDGSPAAAEKTRKDKKKGNR